ncbi:MAG: spermidine/putrescine transport system permease protein [Thermotogaceae bacterium]|nr:spermidine/putrescine transport system permease protein [Thermotogaceae bacterium]
MERTKRFLGFVLSFPGIIWLTLFFLLPTTIIVVYSFMTPGPYGGAYLPFTLKYYKMMITNQGFWILFMRTVVISVISTGICLALALPVAYYIATSKYKNFLLSLVIIPFWTNFLVRIFGWLVILGNNGLINRVLMYLHIIDKPVSLMYNQWSVILVIVYMYLPYMILPLYSSIEKFDFHLLEAAMDLGASRTKTIFSVLLPSIKGGISAGIVLVLIPVLGSYAIPDLVGGKDGAMLGNLIARQLTTARNWPLSSAISMIFLLISTVGLLVYLKFGEVRNRRNRVIYEDYIKEETNKIG